jgi:uncharacterized membrane protein
MKKNSQLLLLTIGALILLVSTISTSAKSTNLCNECHTSYSQYLDILEDNASEIIPQTIGVGETKTVTIQINNQCNSKSYTTLTNVHLTLTSKNGLFQITNPSYTVGTMSVGSKTATWQITGLTKGSDELIITAQGSNTHNKLTFRDTYSPVKTLTITTPQPPSKYAIYVTVKEPTTSNPIQGVTVSLNGTIKTTTSNGTVSFSIEAGNYSLEISKSGYTTYQEAVTISAATNITRTLAQTSLPSYTVKVNVSDSNSLPLQSANITIAGTRSLTDQSGQASFNLQSGTYKITISKTGYLPYSRTLTVSANTSLSATLNTISPQLIFTKIIVTDSTTGTPINEVKVRLGGRVQQTDTSGSTTYNQTSGEYLLELVKTGYISYEENITITANATIERSMDPEQTPAESLPLMVYIHPPIAITAYLLTFTFTALLFAYNESRSMIWVGYTAWILSIFGMVTGMIWAENAWGSYWSWEPRESAMLAITILISITMIAQIEKRTNLAKLLALTSSIAIVVTQQIYFLVAGILAVLIVVALRSDLLLKMEKPKRYAALMKLNRDISWVFIAESIATLGAGYVMTRLQIEPSTTLIVHTYLGYGFATLLLAHIILSFTYPYPWLGYLRTLRGGITANKLVGVTQELSAVALIIVALAQFITGLSWVIPILASLVPLRLHVDLDNALIYLLIIHGVIGVRAALSRRGLRVPGANLTLLLIVSVLLGVTLYIQYANLW